MARVGRLSACTLRGEKSEGRFAAYVAGPLTGLGDDAEQRCMRPSHRSAAAAPALRPRPFAPFEWMVALRYLRARRAAARSR